MHISDGIVQGISQARFQFDSLTLCQESYSTSTLINHFGLEPHVYHLPKKSYEPKVENLNKTIVTHVYVIEGFAINGLTDNKA